MEMFGGEEKVITKVFTGRAMYKLVEARDSFRILVNGKTYCELPKDEFNVIKALELFDDIVNE